MLCRGSRTCLRRANKYIREDPLRPAGTSPGGPGEEKNGEEKTGWEKARLGGDGQGVASTESIHAGAGDGTGMAPRTR
jgi:hypothetical protein